MLLEFNCSEDLDTNSEVWKIMGYAIASFGIIGNLVSVSILIKKEFRETFHRLLLSLAIVDLLYVISVVVREVLRYVRQVKTEERNQFFDLIYTVNETNNLGNTTVVSGTDSVPRIEFEEQVDKMTEKLRLELTIWESAVEICSFHLRYMYFASIYFIVSISCERYFGVCYPIQSRVKGKKRFYLYLFPVLLLSFLIELPQMMVVLKHTIKIPFNDFEKVFFSAWFDYLKPLFTIYLPLVMLIILNLRIFVTIRNSRNSLRTNANATDRERSFATMLGSIVLLFLFTHSLRIPDQVYRSSIDKLIQYCKDIHQLPIIPRWLRVTNLMVEPAGLFNASINFVIYCLTGSRFRTVLMDSARSTFKRRSSSRQSQNADFFALSTIRARGPVPKEIADNV